MDYHVQYKNHPCTSRQIAACIMSEIMRNQSNATARIEILVKNLNRSIRQSSALHPI